MNNKSNKRIKSELLMAWLVSVTFCCTASVVLAGPLDRGEMQPRNNPAASSMIRVPGVLGQSEQSALEILQRAGLNVNTKYISQSIEKYAGRSGMVVKQTPSAGGISMLGSSVTIMIYKEDKPGDESGGGYSDSGDGSNDTGRGYEDAGGGYDNSGGGYGNAGGYDNAGGGNAGGGYDDSGGGGYGDAGGSTGNTGGSYTDSGGEGYSGEGDGRDEATPEGGAPRPDWGLPPSGSN